MCTIGSCLSLPRYLSRERVYIYIGVSYNRQNEESAERGVKNKKQKAKIVPIPYVSRASDTPNGTERDYFFKISSIFLLFCCFNVFFDIHIELHSKTQ